MLSNMTEIDRDLLVHIMGGLDATPPTISTVTPSEAPDPGFDFKGYAKECAKGAAGGAIGGAIAGPHAAMVGAGIGCVTNIAIRAIDRNL